MNRLGVNKYGAIINVNHYRLTYFVFTGEFRRKHYAQLLVKNTKFHDPLRILSEIFPACLL